MSDWNAETAEWYAKKYGDYPTNRFGVDQLYLSAHTTIVDIGCGTGSALRHAASKFEGGALIGIDPVPRMIEIANDLTEGHSAQDRIDFRVGSAEQIPLNDDIANYVLAFDSIDHWQDIPQGLQEVKRILHQAGVFAIVKDKSTPGAKKAVQALAEKLTSAGFELKEKREITKEEISFFLLICQIGE